MQDLSPKYISDLAQKVVNAIWNTYKSYDMVKFYVSKWYKVEWIGERFDGYEKANFEIIESSRGIELVPTLMGMDDETIIKIAIDLGIDTPDFIPCVPIFRNELKDVHPTTSEIFEKAYKLVYDDPSMAIGLANSALESLIKEILNDERISVKYDNGCTLKKLTSLVCKAFMGDYADMPQEIKTISSSLASINGAIEDIRSTKTIVHGKTSSDYVISNPLYAELIVNSIASVGLFLHSFYRKNYPKIEQGDDSFNEYALPTSPTSHNEFDIYNNDIPF